MNQKEWDECKDGASMLLEVAESIGELGGDDHKMLVNCLCDIAETTRDDLRRATRKAFGKCLRTTRSWARNGRATLSDVNRAIEELGRRANADEPEHMTYGASSAWFAAHQATDTERKYILCDAPSTYAAATRVCPSGELIPIIRRYYPHPPTTGGE